MSTKPSVNSSKRYVCMMCRWRLADRNWVSTKTRLIPELMQFDRGMSIIRYLPAKPTAGLALLSVSG